MKKTFKTPVTTCEVTISRARRGPLLPNKKGEEKKVCSDGELVRLNWKGKKNPSEQRVKRKWGGGGFLKNETSRPTSIGKSKLGGVVKKL